MKRIPAVLVALLCLYAHEAAAQLSSIGTDPGGLKWRQITTQDFRVVYPEGLDSLAREYAVSLEKWKQGVGESIGYTPNQSYRTPMPVILHPYLASSNGVVTWAPRRMEIFTVPDASMPLPQSSIEQLVLHESRHVAQMQFAADKPYRWINVLLGELWPGAMSALYPGPTFLEGDAVVAETELSSSGRGRTSTFLGYYDICFAEGDFRDYPRWCYGSQKHYTPDYYRAGYLLTGGVRAFYDDPSFTKRYFSSINSAGLPLFNLQKSVREASGKSLKQTFTDICLSQKNEWEENARSREPFMPRDKVSDGERLYTALREIVTDGEGFFAFRSGLDRTAELVKILPGGRVKHLSDVASTADRLCRSDSTGTLYWSEYRSDPRWELRSSSVIRQMDRNGKTSYLTGRGHKYYNPAVCEGRIAVTEYPDEGGSAAVVLDALSGSVVERFPAPAGMQIVECFWADGGLYFTAVTEEGFGIYDSLLREILAPSRSSLSRPFCRDGRIYFTADRCGSEELYSLDPSDGSVRQMTSSRFGGKYYAFRGDSLYYVSGTREERALYRTALGDLPVRDVDFFEQSFPLIARKLASQASEAQAALPDTSAFRTEDYDKLSHLLKFHSWMPAYVNVDAVSDLSLETIGTDAGLGATALFHNDLNTMQGFVGWSFWTPGSGWRNALHGKFAWRGWYPVIEASFDFGERNALQNHEGVKVSLDVPSFEAGVKAYIPFNLTSGGWSRGVIPQVEFTATNDLFSTGEILRYITTASASVRGYAMLPTPSSCIYPRLGVGAEIGCSFHPGLEGQMASSRYALLYGYLPGLVRTHGLRLSATLRGGSENRLSAQATYALPFASVDWSGLWPVTYVRNFEFKATGIVNRDLSDSAMSSLALKAELAARLGCLLWIPYDTRIGVSVSYDTLLRAPRAALVFNVDM